MNTSPASILDFSSAKIPLHIQIEVELRKLIAQADYQNGLLLPDELTLANRFGVSRGTLRSAVARLVNQGLLERKAGVGTRVRHSAVESSIGDWRSFSREMARRNIQVECFHLSPSRLPAPARVATALQISEGAEVLCIDRTRGWDGEPVLHSKSWIHPRLGLGEDADFTKPLYALIQETTGTEVSSAREEISAVSASATMAEQLQVQAGHPLLLRLHTVYDPGNRPVEFAEVHYVSTRFALTLDLKREMP